MSTFEYLTAWLIYLLAAAGLAWVSWRIYSKYLWREVAYFLQAITLALFFTPWYVMPDANYLAPAIMIVALDTVTIGGTDIIRALVPLVMSVFLALLAAAGMAVSWRVKQERKRRKGR